MDLFNIVLIWFIAKIYWYTKPLRFFSPCMSYTFKVQQLLPQIYAVGKYRFVLLKICTIFGTFEVTEK